ncbi:unnamed protein product [Adineta ricciae]|uniref:Uncharacterized protein n=1 Tax=Adineta ricciae TaxID=249248 RepID=A0A815T5T3_ADIRI|nr:unnamed protein product [Adineta ricciae]CAF1498680.1 unnamed protein product [Adineta ricciae]
MSSNPRRLPENFDNWSSKRKHNWKKQGKNEERRQQYPPYHPASDIDIIHIHHRTNIHIIEKLIQQAQETHRYTVDTESQTNYGRPNTGAVIQIQMVHSRNFSTVILIETFHLADATSSLLEQIKQLWNIIFNSGNEIISWGPIRKEFDDFKHIEWVKIGKIIPKNLQALFQDQEDEGITHPATESRVGNTGVTWDTPGDHDDDDYYDDYYDDGATKIKYSLQTAVIMKLNQFVDKSLTVSQWGCGLDWALETWRTKLFERRFYDQQIEKQTRRNMEDYAVYDCTSVTELYFHMYQEQTDESPKHSDHVSDISEDEEIISIPTKKQEATQEIEQPPAPTFITELDLELEAASEFEEESAHPSQQIEECNGGMLTKQRIMLDQPELLNMMDEDELLDFLRPTVIQQPPAPEPERQQKPERTEEEARQRKQEIQRRKNEKLKWKKQHLPQFQLKMKRPIYEEYDYHRIRAQLAEDEVHHSHEIKIDDRRNTVSIGFRSVEQQEKAKSIVKIDYFGKKQFEARWKKQQR